MNQHWQWWNGIGQENAILQILPKRDTKFAAGHLQAGKCIAALATQVTACTTADFAFFDVVPDVGFTAIGTGLEVTALALAAPVSPIGVKLTNIFGKITCSQGGIFAARYQCSSQDVGLKPDLTAKYIASSQDDTLATGLKHHKMLL